MRVIEGGDIAYQSVMFGGINPSVENYISNQYQNINPNIFTSLGNMAGNFIDKSREIYNNFRSTNVMNIVTNTINKIGSLFDDTRISYMQSISELQNANYGMRMWIMANPNISTLYAANGCEGYGDLYTTPYRDLHQHDNPLYVTVMDGVITDEGTYTNYYGNYENAPEITIDDRDKILRAWELCDIYMEAGFDPTSINNDPL